MRVSSATRGIEELELLTQQFNIYLDGEHLEGCLEADEEAGRVVCVIRGDNNRELGDHAPQPHPDAFAREGLWCEVRHGEVRIDDDGSGAYAWSKHLLESGELKRRLGWDLIKRIPAYRFVCQDKETEVMLDALMEKLYQARRQ